MTTAQTTIDHDEIREWIEEREGRPSVVADTADDDDDESEGAILRVDFGDKDDGLEEVDWDEFFEIFEDSELAFLFQEETKSGKVSRFHKFVARDEDA